jgi:hypothetical protein
MNVITALLIMNILYNMQTLTPSHCILEFNTLVTTIAMINPTLLYMRQRMIKYPWVNPCLCIECSYCTLT